MGQKTISEQGPAQLPIGTPRDAISYALRLSLEDDSDAIIFLNDWNVGDISQWPNYRPAPAPVERDAIPDALFALGGCCLICLAVLLIAIEPRAGLFISAFLVLPCSLLFQAAGLRLPGPK